jgi:hypothetical protein
MFAENDPAAKILLWTGTALFTLLWVSCHGRMDMALDRIVFHLVDYGSLLPEISRAVQQHVEPPSLISYVTSTLKIAMDAESVVFSQSYAEPELDLRNRQSDTAMVPVQTAAGCSAV